MCAIVLREVTCSCDLGYSLAGEDCVENAGWDCAQRHDAPNEDAAEPDECPELAQRLVNEQVVGRTILAARDQDWFTFDVEHARVYEFQIRSTELPLIVEVYEQGLTAPPMTQVVSPPADGLTFAAPQDASYSVRVRAQQAGLTGAYSVAMVAGDLDDFPNSRAFAQSYPGASFQGVFDYAADVDVAWILRNTSSKIRFVPSAGAELEIYFSNRTPYVIRDQPADLIVPAGERVYLTARRSDLASVGAFNFGMVGLGPDDHSDVPDYATVATFDAPMTGQLEREGDVDTFAFDAEQGQLYRVVSSNSARITLSVPAISSAESELVWLASTSGRVVLNVEAQTSISSGQPYTIQLNKLGPDDHGDDFSNASSFSPPEMRGRLELSTDVDVFAFDGPPGHMVQVLSSAPDLFVSILDAQGNALRFGQGEAWTFGTGPMFARVSRSSASPRGLQLYSLRVVVYPQDDHSDEPANATPISSGTVITGAFQHPGDLDLFFVEANEAHAYSLEVTGNAYVLLVPDRNLRFLGGEWRFFAGPGRTTIQLAGTVGSYTLRVTDLGADDHGDTTQSATPIVPGSSLSGVVSCFGDTDCFQFDGVAGHIYDVRLNAPVGLWLADPTNRVHPRGPLTASGRQYWCVWTQGVTPDHPFTISVEDLGTDDHGNTASNATLVTGLTGSGSLEWSGDYDFFSAPVSSQHFYELTSTPGLAAFAQNNLSTFKAVASQAFVFVRANSLSTFPSSYNWSLTDLGADDHEDVFTLAEELTPGVATAGVITLPIDWDVFSLNLVAGATVQITLTGSATVTTRSPSGTYATQTTFVASETGKWTFNVNSAVRGASYTITVQ